MVRGQPLLLLPLLLLLLTAAAEAVEPLPAPVARVTTDTALLWAAGAQWRPLQVDDARVHVPTTSERDPSDEYRMPQHVFARYTAQGVLEIGRRSPLALPDSLDRVTLVWGERALPMLRAHSKHGGHGDFFSSLLAGPGEAAQLGGLSIYAHATAMRQPGSPAPVDVPGDAAAYVAELVYQLTGQRGTLIERPAIVPACMLRVSGTAPSLRTCYDDELDTVVPWAYVWQHVLSDVAVRQSQLGSLTIWPANTTHAVTSPMAVALHDGIRARRAMLGLVEVPAPGRVPPQLGDTVTPGCRNQPWRGARTVLTLSWSGKRAMAFSWHDLGFVSLCGGDLIHRQHSDVRLRVMTSRTDHRARDAVEHQDITVLGDDEAPLRARLRTNPFRIAAGDVLTSLAGQGYHREFRVRAFVQGFPGHMHKLVKHGTACRLRVTQRVPPGAYFDLYQLRDLEEFGDVVVTAWRDIDLERFAHSAPAHVVTLAFNATMIVPRNGRPRLQAAVPVHLRYHASSDAARSEAIVFEPPQVTEVHCDGYPVSYTQAEYPQACVGETCDLDASDAMEAEMLLTERLGCDEYITPRSPWTELDLDTLSPVLANVPVGLASHAAFVEPVTVAVTLLTCVLLLRAIARYPYQPAMPVVMTTVGKIKRE